MINVTVCCCILSPYGDLNAGWHSLCCAVFAGEHANLCPALPQFRDDRGTHVFCCSSN
jgi:hypothetical protein